MTERVPQDAVVEALRYIKQMGLGELLHWEEALSSAALSGNRAADVHGRTLRRILADEPASARGILDLAQMLRNGQQD